MPKATATSSLLLPPPPCFFFHYNSPGTRILLGYQVGGLRMGSVSGWPELSWKGMARNGPEWHGMVWNGLAALWGRECQDADTLPPLFAGARSD